MGLELTVDEIVATLKRSSLTTVVVEGKDDVLIYRWMEDEIGVHNANFFPCGGRDKLLQVYDRRHEFSELKTVFVADKDTFVYTSVPEDKGEIVWTNGYSIENDLYYGRKIESLLSTEEKINFEKSLASFINYYAFEIDNLLNNREFCFRNHPQKIICEQQHQVKEDFLESVNFSEPPESVKKDLEERYDVLIRGKSLFALLTRILSSEKREIKHSKLSLLEHCYRTHQSTMFIGLIEEVRSKISA